MADYLPTTMKYFDTLLGEQLLEGEGGGGGSWQTVFEGSVTTVAEDNVFSGEIEGLGSLTANTIKVTLNGVEYTCERDQDGYYGAPFNFETEQYDWSEFPFVINTSEPGETWLVTQTAGTYTLKIEEQQSGGSSDFSTAEVTVNNSASDSYIDFTGVILENDELVPSAPSLSEATNVLTVVLYKNIQHLYINADSVTSISGNISGNMLDGFDVTGDCVINAVGYSDMG